MGLRLRAPPQRRRGARVSGLAGLLGQPFLRYAFIAGAAIAAASGLTGYFVVLRSQVFTGDALSHVAFTGALAALAAGADLLDRPLRRLRARRRWRWPCSATAAGPTTRSSAACSPGSSGSARCSCPSTRRLASGRGRHVRGQRAVRHDLRAVGLPGGDRLGGRGLRLRGADPDRQAAAVRQPRRGGRERPAGPGQGARHRLPRPGRRHRGRRHPGRRARCCCSACSPRRPGLRSGSPRGLIAGCGCPLRSRSARSGSGL